MTSSESGSRGAGMHTRQTTASVRAAGTKQDCYLSTISRRLHARSSPYESFLLAYRTSPSKHCPQEPWLRHHPAWSICAPMHVEQWSVNVDVSGMRQREYLSILCLAPNGRPRPALLRHGHVFPMSGVQPSTQPRRRHRRVEW